MKLSQDMVMVSILLKKITVTEFCMKWMGAESIRVREGAWVACCIDSYIHIYPSFCRDHNFAFFANRVPLEKDLLDHLYTKVTEESNQSNNAKVMIQICRFG